MPIRILVSGNGKMGREVLAASCREADLEPVGVVDLFATEEYISLLPIGSPLAALSTKYGCPAVELFLSYRLSIGEFVRTDSMPFVAPDFCLYRSLVRMISPLPALRLK